VTKEFSPQGRVIGVEYEYDYQPSDPAFQEELGPNDVVWIPLYKGTLHHPPRRTDRPRKEAETNWQAIRALAPRVQGILVGCTNAEIHYKGLLRTHREEYALCIRFVQEHGERIRPFGRPVFAPIFEMLIFDCYRGGGKLRDLLNSFDALVLSFAGCYWLFENPRPKIPEASPYPRLAEYLRTLNAWSGVGLQKGLDAGSGEVLHKMGYRAGFMGSW